MPMPDNTNSRSENRPKRWIIIVIILVVLAALAVAYFVWVKPSRVNITHKPFTTKVEDGIIFVSVPAGAEMYATDSQWTSAWIITSVIRTDSMSKSEYCQETYFLDNYSLFFEKEEFAQRIDAGETSFFLPYDAVFPTPYGRVYMFCKGDKVLLAVERTTTESPLATTEPAGE